MSGNEVQLILGAQNPPEQDAAAEGDAAAPAADGAQATDAAAPADGDQQGEAAAK